MGLDPTPFKNPWDRGGQYHPESTWAQEGQRYGFDYGNEYFTPKTKAEIRDEGLLQMAVLALVLAAPAIVGAIGGGGAAGGAVGAEAAGAVAGQGASGAGISTGAAVGVAMAPFLRPQAKQELTAQAQLGGTHLNRYFHEIAPINGPGFQNQFEWQSQQLHPAMAFVEGFMENPSETSAILSRSNSSSSALGVEMIQNLLDSMGRNSFQASSPALISPLATFSPAPATGSGPPDFMVDSEGKVTPLMELFMETAYGFDKGGIRETVHRTVEPAWWPGDVTRGLIAEIAFSGNANAITLGKYVIYKDDFWYGTTISLERWFSIIIHEHTHRDELNYSSDIGWYAAYLTESATTSYRDLSFEKRAYYNDGLADKFITSSDGGRFLKIWQDPTISEGEKGLWATFFALQFIRAPLLNDEITEINKEITLIKNLINSFIIKGEPVPDVLNLRLKFMTNLLAKRQKELKTVQIDIAHLNSLGYK